jgi:hypothetical protein
VQTIEVFTGFTTPVKPRITPSMRNTLAAGMALVCAALVSAQEPVIKRSAPITLTGEIVDISCYKQKGVAGGTGTVHVDCAKSCILEKDAAVGILTDGDGLFKIWGQAAQNKYAKVLPFVGQTVEITGTEVTLSNNYDVRSFDLQTVKRKGK